MLSVRIFPINSNIFHTKNNPLDVQALARISNHVYTVTPTFFVLIVPHDRDSIFLSARAILKKQPRVLECQTLSASIVTIETLVITGSEK